MAENTLLYKSLKKDLEQKAIVAADPATTAMVVTKTEFITYKNQTEKTLQTMQETTSKAQETVDNLIQGHTPLKGIVVYRDDIADNNGIAITENQDSNLAIYKVNEDGSPSDVKLLLNNKEVVMKSDLSDYVDLTNNQTISGAKTFTKGVNINGSGGLSLNDANGNISLNIYSGSSRTDKSYFVQRSSDGKTRSYYLNYNGPTSDADLVDKQYVDKAVANIPKPDLSSYVDLHSIQFIDGQKLYSLTPVEDLELTNKEYVDNAISNKISSAQPRILTGSTAVQIASLKGTLTISNSSIAQAVTQNKVIVQIEDSVGGVYIMYKNVVSDSNITFSIYHVNGNKDVSTTANIRYKILYWN